MFGNFSVTVLPNSRFFVSLFFSLFWPEGRELSGESWVPSVRKLVFCVATKSEELTSSGSVWWMEGCCPED